MTSGAADRSGVGDLITWLRATCSGYELESLAAFRKRGNHDWPLEADDESALVAALDSGGHFLPLPREPAALANVVEVSLVDFLISRLERLAGARAQRGTERGYPDIEISGEAFGGGFHALDIKVARRAKGGRQTQSAITLYTGNTYFRYPTLHWRGTFRPFQAYDSHLVLIALYTLNRESMARIDDLELIVTESWRVASRQRSSTTREHIGAVKGIDDLRSGNGAFAMPEAFLAYWRKHPFKIGRVVQQQLDALLREQSRSARETR